MSTGKEQIVKITNNKGDETIERLPEPTVRDLKSRGVDVEDPKTGQKGVGLVVNEDLESGDFINLAKQIGKVVTAALQDHGDEVATITAKDYSPQGVTLKVMYKEDDVDDWGDEFRFEIREGGKLVLLPGWGEEWDMGTVSQRSGTIEVQKDLLQDKFTQFINKQSSVKNISEESEVEIDEAGRQAFAEAVRNHKASKSKETVKKMLEAARAYPGDTLPQKFKAAAEDYFSQGTVEQPEASELPGTEELPVEEPVADQLDCEAGDIRISMSLFIRMMEWAKEEVKDDVEIHEAAERIQEKSKTGCATMNDYNYIVGSGNAAEEEDDDMVKENWFDPSEDELEDIRHTSMLDFSRMGEVELPNLRDFVESNGISIRHLLEVIDKACSVEMRNRILDTLKEEFDLPEPEEGEWFTVYMDNNRLSELEVLDVLDTLLSPREKNQIISHANKYFA